MDYLSRLGPHTVALEPFPVIKGIRTAKESIRPLASFAPETTRYQVAGR